MHLLRIFKIKSQKMRLWHPAIYETMQQKKRTRYRQQLDITHFKQLDITHFIRRDFLCLRHSQSHSRKVENMHLLRIFKIKSQKMRLWYLANYETMQQKKRTRYQQQCDIQIEIFSCLRHPQSHSRKVETMHLLRIFKIRSSKCDYGALLIARRCNRRNVQDLHNNLNFTHFPSRDFFMLETPAKSFQKSQNYAPVKNLQDQKFEKATMAHC